MSTRMRKRIAFRPSVTDSKLEERLVLTGGVAEATTNPAVTAVITAGTTTNGLPAPAATPISPQAAKALAATALPHMTLAKIHKAYNQQARAAIRDLRAAVQTQVGQLYANGATPTSQQVADFNASIAGALDATALRLSTQAALLPGSTRLISRIQSGILGSGANSLVNRLSTLAQSGRLSGTSGTSSAALARTLNATNRQDVTNLGNFFTNTPINTLSVSSTGQHIPVQQYMGNQLLSQTANTFGALAQSFPAVANAVLYPNGTNIAPTQSEINTFNTLVGNALNTAAFQLGSGLSVFPGTSNLITQIQPILFGSNSPINAGASSAINGVGNSLSSANTGIGTSVGSANTGIGTSVGSANTGTGTSVGSGINGLASNTATSLAAALQGLQYGSTGFNTAVSNAFGTAFQNLVTPLGQFFGSTGMSNMTLPTSGFASPYASAYTGSSFYNGFNSGFATGSTPGYVGFGVSPNSFNTSFGTGFNNLVTNYNTGLGLGTANIGSLGGFVPSSTGGVQGGTVIR